MNSLTDCEICNGTGWVCENHREIAYGDKPEECNCGAAANCVCNPNGKTPWQAVYASIETEVDEWVH